MEEVACVEMPSSNSVDSVEFKALIDGLPCDGLPELGARTNVSTIDCTFFSSWKANYQDSVAPKYKTDK